jgi:hypothetical protein
VDAKWKSFMGSAPRIKLLVLEHKQTHKQLLTLYVSSVPVVLFAT